MRLKRGEIITPHVKHWVLLRNGWEYFLFDMGEDNAPGEDIRFALVYGDATEMGDVSMEEVKPYILVQTVDLTDIAPPPDWEWTE
jgi:hypothetical protein